MNAQVAITRQLIERGELDIWEQELAVARLIAKLTTELAELSRLMHVDEFHWPQALLLAGGLARSAKCDNPMCDVEAIAEQLARVAVPLYALAEVVKVDLPFVAVREARSGGSDG
jgi:NTP pyrophosphatase (non-canonical NTP hydrolase)